MTAKSKAREHEMRVLAKVHDEDEGWARIRAKNAEWREGANEWRRYARAHRIAARLLRAEARRLETAAKGRGRS